MNNQNILLYSLIIIALWLMFTRKVDGFCPICMA